jgi:short subunit dehydrogenase-like uncharacterized protein
VPGQIVLFGATGYTGRLTAAALVARGERPVLAARNSHEVKAMARKLGRLDSAVADVSRPETVRELVERGDVLISTVGPFVRWGGPAVRAAIAAGAHYLDSTGEGTFIREVFERHDDAARAAGCGLITAFGYDWVPGNLAGGLALREAGEAARRLDIGYYMTGSGAGGMSGGTRASTAGMMLEPAYTFRAGRVVTERGASRLRSFPVRGRERPAVSVGSSEHFALPRLADGLRDVDVYLGWFGSMSRALQGVSAATSLVTRVPGARSALEGTLTRLVKGSSGGPDAAQRAQSGSHVVAIASDADGQALAEVHLEGPNGYTFTADILAWGAATAAREGLRATGALGPVDGFGLDQLRGGCAEAGLTRV